MDAQRTKIIETYTTLISNRKAEISALAGLAEEKVVEEKVVEEKVVEEAKADEKTEKE